VRFPYRSFPGSPPDERYRVRPSIPARVIGLSRDALLYGLLDTGSELVLLDLAYLKSLDVHVKHGDQERGIGVSGHEFDIYYGVIDIELANSRRTKIYRWHAKVGFTKRPKGQGAIFGYEGFLQYFHTSFHGPKRHVSLVPRVTLPLPCMPVD
jgi:hypothetical protein